jgi:transcriptional regulator with XRE-family HTH domain
LRGYQIARRLGISPSTLTDWSTAARPVSPDNLRFEALCRFLGLSTEEALRPEPKPEALEVA